MFLSVMALHARAIQEDYRMAEEKARISYAFGMIIGSYLNTAPVDLDYNAVTDGVRAILDRNAEPQFSEQEAVEIVETALHRAMERVTAENRMIEEEFLFTNSMRPGVQVTPSGLQYEVIEETAGEKPESHSIVKITYMGTFVDGSLFDSSDGEGAYIPLEMIIPGLVESIRMMSIGSVYRFYIPSNLAYGRDGIQGIIPPYSTLIFTVELLEIISDDDFDPFADFEF
jgi:FKBP-type peptidyl-prolyl cis-trans isomerase